MLAEAVGRSVLEGLQVQRRTRPDSTHDGFRERLIKWGLSSAVWSPPWRTVEDPWLVLVGELVLSRARPVDAERMFDGLRRIAPDAGALTALADPAEELSDLGLGDRSRP